MSSLKKTRSLRSNKGGDHTIQKEFKTYYSKHGIRHEKTIPSTPTVQWYDGEDEPCVAWVVSLQKNIEKQMSVQVKKKKKVQNSFDS